MVDYAIANQIRPFQLPDIAGIAGAMQGLELNRMRSQQLQGAEQERNALRQLMGTPGFDPSSPDAARRLLEVAPTTGAATYQALMAGQREQRQAQTAQTEAGLKAFDLSRESLRGIAALPEADRPRAWAAWRARTEATVPGTQGFIPSDYSDEAYTAMISKADEIARNLTERPTALAGPGGIPVFADRRTNTFRMGTEVSPGGPAPAPTPPASGAPAPRAAAPGLTPGQAAAAPRSQSTDPLLIDAAIRRNEGTGRNPASSAVGPYQFVDSTFVDQFRRNFPDIARNLPPEQILTFRGAQLPDGRRVEDVMGPALTRQNQESLTRAGFAPSAGNTYLAHFLGAGGAQAVLRADPNTPISQLVSPEAIRANPSILGVPGVTAGQIVQWANNTIDVGPRDARQRLSSGNAMAPNAAPANAMLAPPDATVVPRPLSPVEFPGAPRPASLSDADLLRRIRDVQQKEAEALMLADVQRQTAAARAAEAGQTAESQTRGRLTAEQERENRRKQEGRENIEKVLEDMKASYQRLEELRGIPSERRGAAANIPAYLAATPPGQEISKALGTQSQSQRNALEASGRQLLTAIKAATGMSAQEMNSNAELKQLRDAISNPTQSIESVREILARISRNYGLGRLEFNAPPEPAAAPAAPAPAASREGVPRQRRGAAPTQGQYQEGQTATGPNGQRVIFRGGQWVPVQ